LTRYIYLTVETDEAILRITVNPDTGKVESLEKIALGDEPAPFSVATKARTYVSLSGGKDRNFTMTLSMAASSPPDRSE
jgi:hypothetical protein